MLVKQCLKKGICGKVYKKGESGYELDYCELCGAPLEVKEVKDEVQNPMNKNNSGSRRMDKPNNQKGNNSSPIIVDEYGYIHFSDREEENFKKGPKLIIYKEDVIHKVIKLVYDKTLVDTKMLEVSRNDEYSLVSSPEQNRENTLFYKINNNYYVQNLSEGGSVHVDDELLAYNERRKIEDGEFVVLNTTYWIEFKIN